MTRLTYGTQAACRVCNQDIEYHGIYGWIDRGGNRLCVAYRQRDGEIVQPRKGTKHKPFVPAQS